jgi:Glycosyltransferase
MNIAFDAKRAFHNTRGLGNYSRYCIHSLTTCFTENNYYLFNPSAKNNISFPITGQTKQILPQSLLGKAIPSFWRSKGMCKQIKSLKANIYHGLSQELPFGIDKTGAKAIVTMHDAIFMRYPKLYSPSYRTIFIKKNQFACRVADHIIAISEQTKRDFIEYFNVDEKKISVIYQGCDPIFREQISEENKKEIRKKYNLPQQFVLNIGAIEERKNAALIIEALHRGHLDTPLVIAGKPTSYIDKLKTLISKYKMERQVIFIHNAETIDLPTIYALSDIFIYPSIFEGFGIPILEALCTGTPIISSTGSCFEETGGPHSIYVNPRNADEMAEAINKTLNDKLLRDTMKKEGLIYSETFSDQNFAQKTLDVYQSL